MHSWVNGKLVLQNPVVDAPSTPRSPGQTRALQNALAASRAQAAIEARQGPIPDAEVNEQHPEAEVSGGSSPTD